MSEYRIDIRIGEQWTVGVPMEMSLTFAQEVFESMDRYDLDEVILRDSRGNVIKRYPEGVGMNKTLLAWLAALGMLAMAGILAWVSLIEAAWWIRGLLVVALVAEIVGLVCWARRQAMEASE